MVYVTPLKQVGAGKLEPPLYLAALTADTTLELWSFARRMRLEPGRYVHRPRQAPRFVIRQREYALAVQMGAVAVDEAFCFHLDARASEGEWDAERN